MNVVRKFHRLVRVVSGAFWRRDRARLVQRFAALHGSGVIGLRCLALRLRSFRFLLWQNLLFMKRPRTVGFAARLFQTDSGGFDLAVGFATFSFESRGV
jgi:hypothetical protein